MPDLIPAAMHGVVVIDILLALASATLAILCLTTRNLFKGIVLFITLGLTITIAWARLGAWDVAIAEAAIGAGLTGALLIVTWRKLKQTPDKSTNSVQPLPAAKTRHLPSKPEQALLLDAQWQRRKGS